jgi:hypothetical protein
VIAEIGKIELYSWAFCFLLQVMLMGLLISRRNQVVFPAFTVYLAGSLAQNIATFLAYSYWGFNSNPSREIAWGFRMLIAVLRIMAVLEISRQVFGQYRGIWAFIWRTVLGCVCVTALLSMMSPRGFAFGILYGDRAIGLSEAVAIVALMMFARYYQVRTGEPIRSLAIGFFLYACFEVLNDTLLEALPKSHSAIWNFLGTISYTSSLLVWGWALRQTAPQSAMAPEMLPASVYRTVSPQVNQRLTALNDRLGGLFKQRVERP